MRRANKRQNNFVGRERAQQMFVTWLEKRDPFLHKASRRVAVMRKQNLNGMGAIDWGGLFTSAVDTIKTALPTYLQTKQQKQIMDVQINRAKQGLPPLDAAQYVAPIRIEPTINADTEAGINRVATQTVSSGVQKLIIPIGLGLLAWMLLRKRR